MINADLLTRGSLPFVALHTWDVWQGQYLEYKDSRNDLRWDYKASVGLTQNIDQHIGVSDCKTTSAYLHIVNYVKDILFD